MINHRSDIILQVILDVIYNLFMLILINVNHIIFKHKTKKETIYIKVSKKIIFFFY